jgi:transposase
MIEKITIDNTNDCQKCQNRHKEHWQLMNEVKVITLGTACCHECGREYTVIVEEEDVIN